jgi:hypothetical protein
MRFLPRARREPRPLRRLERPRELGVLRHELAHGPANLIRLAAVPVADRVVEKRVHGVAKRRLLPDLAHCAT